MTDSLSIFQPTPLMNDILNGTGMATAGRAVTATLFVSPDGNDADGLTWDTAYTTIQGALDAASTDANDCTLILIAPTATFYDIATTGDPTWSCNVHIQGTHRIWAAIRNEHASATSVFKFTGKASIQDLAIFTAGSVNGVIFTGSGWRVRNCGFNSTGTSGATTSVHLDGSGALTRGGIMEDVEFLGNVSYTTAIHIEQSTINHFHHVNIRSSLVGVKITDSDSDGNQFDDVMIMTSALGLDIDAGNMQMFNNVDFHGNTRNVDDEVGDHEWTNPMGEFDIYITPADFTGTVVAAGVGNNTYCADAELIAANAIDNPFRIVGIHAQPTDSEWHAIRLTASAGTPWFDEIMFDGNKREGSAAPSGTEHIFNTDTRISCGVKSVTGSNNVAIWLEIQVI